MVSADTKVSGNTIVQSTRRYVVWCTSLRALCIDGIQSHATTLLQTKDPSMTLEKLKSPIRRGLLAGSAAALFARLFAFTSLTQAQTMTTSEATNATKRSKQPADSNAIRPFRVSFPQVELTDLRRRIKA